jgi:hypothetical protein
MNTFACFCLYAVVSVVFAVVSAQALPSCTAWSNSEFGSNFYPTPQSGSSGQTLSCALYTDLHCCTSLYDQQIANGTDLLTQEVATKLDLANHPFCASAFNHLACAQCAPDQGVWLEQLTSQKFHLRICDAVCKNLYTSCLQTPVLTQNFSEVQSVYQNSDEFCYSILNTPSWSVTVVSQSDDRQCFNPFVPLCTSNSINHFYTECVNGKRDLYFYWSPTTTCAGGIKLPNPVVNITCPVICSAGYYLPLGNTTCAPCPMGTTSSTSRCIGQWSQWPTDITIRSYCTQTPFYEDVPIPPNCVAWALKGDRIETQINGLEGISAVLQIIVKTVQPGYLKWIGSVDAEAFYDRFSLYIDSKLAVRLNNSLTAQTFTHPLTVGDHSFEWIYSKDGSWDVGSDSAKIMLIEINGVMYNVEQCVDIHSDPCTCFSTNSCDLRLPCTVNDYESYYTPCVDGLTRLAYRWKEPMICNNVTGVSLPPPSAPILCQEARCPLGSWSLNVSGGVCVPCPVGYYGTLDNPLGCALCPEGKYSTVVGATSCRECGVGTFSNQNRTDCETTCSFNVSTRFGLKSPSTFNLRSFPASMDWYDNSGTKQYRVSLCKKQPYCYFDEFNQRVCEPPAFVFEIDSQHVAPRRIGATLTYLDGNSDADFWLRYQSDGEVPYNCSKQNSAFLVHLVCGMTTYSPKVTPLPSTDSCVIVFEVETREACRSCIPSDYYPQVLILSLSCQSCALFSRQCEANEYEVALTFVFLVLAGRMCGRVSDENLRYIVELH